MELSPAFAGAAAKISATIAKQQKQAPVRLMPPLRWRWIQIRFHRTRRDRVLAVLAYRYSQGVRRLRRDWVRRPDMVICAMQGSCRYSRRESRQRREACGSSPASPSEYSVLMHVKPPQPD